MKEVCNSKAANVSLQCLCVFSDNTMLLKKEVTPGTFVSLNLDSRVHVRSCVKSLKQLCLLSVETDVSLLLCLRCSEVYMSVNDHLKYIVILSFSFATKVLWYVN